MSDRAELALHALGGAAIAALELWATDSAVMAIWWALLVSYCRESEQARAKRLRDGILTGHRYRPGDPRGFSAHRWRELLAFPAGALVAVAGYALR
jgi:hypothetical protein